MTKTTMGSKREEKVMKDAEKAVETKSNRKSVGETVDAKQRPATKRRLKADLVNTTGPWYLKDSEELAGVTNEASNPALGINEIRVFEPSDAQWNNGVVAIVQLYTVIGEIKGIQVWDSARDDSMYVRMQSRSYEREGQKQYVNDVTLDRKVQAQILRHVQALTEEV
ncbi:hypothetical protein QO179_25010 [Bacillus stercoris]|nr:hypothetical protein [Bacillus stercoris]